MRHGIEAAVGMAVVALLCISHSHQEAAKLSCRGLGCRGLNVTTSAPSTARNTTTTHPKPSKFDENFEDTIPVDIGENGTLIPDYHAKDKVGTIVLTKSDSFEDVPPPPLRFDSNIVLRKKFSNRGKKKLPSEEPVTVTPTNVTSNSETNAEKLMAKDIDGDYGTRIEKRKSSGNKTMTVTVNPLVLKRRTKRPKRSPIQFYDDGRSLYQYGGNKHRRYVRFPLSDFPPTGLAGFRPGRPMWAPNNQFPDSIVPRSPRLVFRDPVEPGTLQAPFFNPAGNLQDISAPEENRGNPTVILLVTSN
ncbi:hypothetical protein J6590_062816 [Homalodisca vitripennis]|nr:hypothetical protein J6590_062816 [Homalodisca vitripennis]